MFNKKIVHLSLYLDYLQFNSSYYYDLSFGNEMEKFKNSFNPININQNSKQNVNTTTKQKSFKDALTFNLKNPSELELNKQLLMKQSDSENQKVILDPKIQENNLNIKSYLFTFEELVPYLIKYPIQKNLLKQLKCDIKHLLDNNNSKNNTLLSSLQFILEILWNETYSNDKNVIQLYEKILYFYEHHFYEDSKKRLENKNNNHQMYGKMKILSKIKTQ